MDSYLKLTALALILTVLTANGVPFAAATVDNLTLENSSDNLYVQESSSSASENQLPSSQPPENSQPDNSAHDNPGSGSYFENFNDLALANLAGQAGWVEASLRGSGGLSVSTELPYEGTKGIASPTHYSTTYRAYREISPVQMGNATAYMRVSSGAWGTFWLCEGKAPENGREVGYGCARIVVGIDGQHNLLRFGALTVPIASDNWYKVAVEWDAPATTAKVWVNDEYQGEFTISSPMLSHVDGIMLDVPDQTRGLKVYFDAISITTGVAADNTPPSSSVLPFEGDNYWQVEAPFTVTATASDDLSGVANVSLYYRHSLDNSTWEDSWENFGVGSDGPDEWSWSFTAPDGYGYYEFCSVAEDQAGNVEDTPGVADARCVVLLSDLQTDQDREDWIQFITFENIIVLIGQLFVEQLQNSLLVRGYTDLYTILEAYGTLSEPLIQLVPFAEVQIVPSNPVSVTPLPDLPEPSTEMPPTYTPPPSTTYVDKWIIYLEQTWFATISTYSVWYLLGGSEITITLTSPTGVEYPVERVPGTNIFLFTTTTPELGVWTVRIQAENVLANTVFFPYLIYAGFPATVNIDPDTLNLKSNGKWATGYIELPEPFDVNNIDISTVTIGTSKGGIRAESDSSYGFVKNPEIKDRDGDGLPELMVKFNRCALTDIVDVGEQLVTISGRAGDVPFLGQTSIRVR